MASPKPVIAARRGRRDATRVTLFVVVALTAATAFAQDPDPSQPQPPRLVGTPATAVLVDIVVRDRQGALVTDMVAADVEVLEDGVPQTTVLFEAPSGRRAPTIAAADPAVPAAPPTSSTLPGAATPTGAPRLVAMVFEQLGAEARVAAHKAARRYVEEQKGPDEFVGVFAIDRSLQTLVPYTRDLAAVQRGLRTAAMRPGCPMFFAGDVAPAAGADDGACGDDLPPRQRAIGAFQALTAVVDALQLVPGRKSVLLFSEGIPLESESDVMKRFNTMIGRANRSGVSFYTVDAAGLRARSPSAGPRKAMREFSAETPGVTISPDQVMFQEPYVTLSRLARETGGAFLDNTNELERAARRMGEDLRAYYVLGYVPTNAALDGAYRRIDVRVKRADVTVQARAGYLALPPRRMLGPHDVAPLLTLEQGRKPRDFPFEADVDTTRSPTAVRARVERRVLHYARLADSATCRARLTVLARAVDKDGRTLWIGSDVFDLSNPEGHCDAAKTGTTTFERDVTLPHGAVRVDVIAYDVLGERASVREIEVRAAKRERSR